MAASTPARAPGPAGAVDGKSGNGSGPSLEGLTDYLVGVREELKPPRTTWPTRSELYQLTKVVLVIIFLVAAYCGALDGLMSFATDKIFK